MKARKSITTRTFRCLTCSNSPLMSPAEFKEHLKSVHHIETEGLKVKMSGRLFLDGANFAHNTWEGEIPCEVGRVKFQREDTITYSRNR